MEFYEEEGEKWMDHWIGLTLRTIETTNPEILEIKAEDIKIKEDSDDDFVDTK
jgi:hypothetical protein